MITPNTLSQIRASLDEAERLIVIMHETPDGVLRVIRQVEEIDRLLGTLDSSYDKGGEESRAEALRERLVRESARTASLVRAGGLEPQLADSPIWRSVQAAQADQARRRRTALLRWGLALGLLALLLFVVVPRIFPPTPVANIDAVSRLAVSGDEAGALQLARTEQAGAPQDATAAIWIGALEERAGNTQAAEAAWEQARALLNDPDVFLFERAQARLQLEDERGAEADARQLVARPDPGPQAQGQLILGVIYESQGKIREALSAYEQAGQLGDQAGNTQLTVAARARMAALLQRPPVVPTP
jgi:tetratricopeptide (TPR) repeat protein